MSPARLSDPRDREERAGRILDVAGDLLLRWGYRRVTIEDIARYADIGKGTVYLHWKTRDELFGAVFEREVLAAVDELLAALRQDPRGWLPHRLARSYFLAIMSRPLLRGLFLADAEMLGKLARPGNDSRDMRHHLVSRAYFELLAEHGVLHPDLSTEATAYGFLATLEGFIRSESTADQQHGLDLQKRSELLARTVQRAVETRQRVSPATTRAIASHVIGLFSDLAEADRADLDLAGETGPSPRTIGT
jgi:AcrR family transcriptional regulator